MAAPAKKKHSKFIIVLALISGLFSTLAFLAVFTVTSGIIAVGAFAAMSVCAVGAFGMAYQLVTGKTLDISSQKEKVKNSDGYYDPETGEVFPYKSYKRSQREVIADWESRLTSVWKGSEHIEFTYEKKYGEKTRRSITLQEVLLDPKGQPYFRGFCHLRAEERTFDAHKITTKILSGSKRYDLEDYLVDVLEISEEILFS